jgi:hypothetical protein
MNWLHFFLWIAGIYGLYYIFIILLDIAKAKRSPAAKSAGNELVFSENIHPQRPDLVKDMSPQMPAGTAVKDMNAKVKREPEIVASGGVNIRDLFNLARQEAILYTRPVSF